MPRIVSWFSSGAASAVATHIALNSYKQKYPDHEFIVASIYLKDEHSDSHRFLKDCEKWFNHPIIVLQDVKHNASVDAVVEKYRYMSGVTGARCTKELKKQVRLDWQRHDDVHVFGMTKDEEHRINRLIDNENEILLWSPLIDNGYTKDMCFKELDKANIKMPEMYQLGFNNNNCIGCLKAGGAGYWNHTRKHFSDVYETRSKQEQLLNVSLVKVSYKKFNRLYPEIIKKVKTEEKEKEIEILKLSDKGVCRMQLRYLPENYGDQKSMYVGDCGFFCEQGELFN